MFFANDELGVRTHIDEADPQKPYTCPACRGLLIQKRGSIVRHHFAHEAQSSCDPWYTGKFSSWHKRMQDLFSRHCQEVVVWNLDRTDYHIADILYYKDKKPYVIELQHSKISHNDFVGRTNFYIGLGYKMIWIFDFCTIAPPKTIFYTEILDSKHINVEWPGKDRIRFLDGIEFDKYSNDLFIYFHISTGKGIQRLITYNDYLEGERWEYVDPFHREHLFVQLHLPSFESTKQFFALPYSENDFYKMLSKAGKNSKNYSEI